MKKVFIYTIRVICAIIGCMAFVMQFGEPTDEVQARPLFGIKLLFLLIAWIAYRVYLLTLTEEERKKFHKKLKQ